MKLPSEIKAVIFDVDGLIIDSEPAWQKSHNEFIDKYKLSVDEKYKASFRGIGLKELIVQLKEKFHLEQSVDQLLEAYRKIFYKHFLSSGTESLLTGVEECVKAFYAKGFQLAIATGGHTNETLQTMFQTFNLLKYFPIIISSDEVHRGKPNPDVFFLAAERLNRKPSECLVLEDSINGVRAGKAAGMLVYGVNSHDTIFTELKEHGADEVFHSLSEVIL